MNNSFSKERPILFSGPMVRAILEGRKTQTRRPVANQIAVGRNDAAYCPFGQPGDRLWVRETVCIAPSKSILYYRANFTGEEILFPTLKWTPSIHMPRWASRITLEITNVRVERIQEISAADTIAEGYPAYETTMDGFARSWKAIYPGSWDRNDWVWVIEFNRVQP